MLKHYILPSRCSIDLTGATGLVTQGLKKNLEAIPGKHSMDSIQKTAVVGMSHVVWEVLQSET
jgi:hypothetical protein